MNFLKFINQKFRQVSKYENYYIKEGTMNTPLVSFIIPYYNHKLFIAQTLNSIVEDSYPNKEIILLNDGSSDPDDTIITEWIDTHRDQIPIQYISRENKGVTKTINELIELSHGKYIALIASDDYLINNTITMRVEILEQHYPNKLMLLSDAVVVDNDDQKIFESAMFEQRGAPKKNYFTDNGLKKEIIKRWSVVGPTGFIARELFDIIGKYDESLMIEDWDFYLRVVAKDLLLFYDKKVAAYRWHPNNTSQNKENERKRDIELCLTMKHNIHHFSFPYNFMLWRRYRKCKKRLKFTMTNPTS